MLGPKAVDFLAEGICENSADGGQDRERKREENLAHVWIEGAWQGDAAWQGGKPVEVLMN
jgi:hypothetical protein